METNQAIPVLLTQTQAPRPVASISERFFRTRPADPSEERIRRYLQPGVPRP